jgi:membrane-bound metal-dependent hydrolase YbcI (DUF457 family)
VYLAPLSGVPLGTVTHVAGLLVDGRPDRIAVTFGDDVVLELAPVAPLALARPATHRTLTHSILFFFCFFLSYYFSFCFFLSGREYSFMRQTKVVDVVVIRINHLVVKNHPPML